MVSTSSRPPTSPVRNPVIGCSVLPRRYSAASIPSSSTTRGVIQPAHTLSRGKTAASITTTSRPACLSFHAQADPAGPPPTIRTSQVSIVNKTRGSLVLRPWALVRPWSFASLVLWSLVRGPGAKDQGRPRTKDGQRDEGPSTTTPASHVSY